MPPLLRQIIWQIILQLVLIALNAVFACAEIAAIEAKGAKLDRMAEEGDKKAIRLKKLTDTPARFLAVIQVAITLAGFLGSAFAAENFSVYIVNGLHGFLGMSDALLNTISVILITIILSYLTLVFGELVPKRLAMQNPIGVACALSGPVMVISKVFSPLVWVLTASTNGVLKLLRVDPDKDDEDVSEQDIRLMAEMGEENGSIDEDENEMIQNVFEFDDITVGEIATHRTELTVLSSEDDDAAWYDTVCNDVHTCYPICGDGMDDIVGILQANIYLRLADRSRDSVMAQAVTKPLFVSQYAKAKSVFEMMKETGISFAVVADEYGGTHGIVTQNDLIKQIVGDFTVEEEESGITADADGGYTLEGQLSVEEIDDLFDIELDGTASTIGGWVSEQLGKIPEAGDTVEFENVSFVVLGSDENRITEVYVKRVEPVTEEQSEAAEAAENE